eukprot:jgi/Botrbrau1/11645/Bobra.168_2s0003.1
MRVIAASHGAAAREVGGLVPPQPRPVGSTEIRTWPTQRRLLRRSFSKAAAIQKVEGVVFDPFNEVQGELSVVSSVENGGVSFARTNYKEACEAAVNDQINIEYTISYIYHAMYSYFDRDNVGLVGLAEYFNEESKEERGHAEKLMKFQNLRGGRIKLQSILAPETEYDHPEKGDALYAMELSLSLEKLNFQKLQALHDIAAAADDAQMCEFIESELLAEQARAVKKVSEYVAQLRRVGKGLGVFEFDRWLSEQGA